MTTTESYTYEDLAGLLALGPDDVQRVATFAGAFADRGEHTRTGRLPRPWTGRGSDFPFSREQLDELAAEWHGAAQVAESVSHLTLGTDPEIEEIAGRYRPTRA